MAEKTLKQQAKEISEQTGCLIVYANTAGEFFTQLNRAENSVKEKKDIETFDFTTEENDQNAAGEGTAAGNQANAAGEGTAAGNQAKAAGEGTAAGNQEKAAGEGTAPGNQEKAAGEGATAGAVVKKGARNNAG